MRSRKRDNSEREADVPALDYRVLSVRADSVNIEGRTVETTISTETPVLMPDWERMEMIPEVLLTSGVEFPSNRQVPFLDSHNRNTNSDQFGSARSIRSEGNQVVGVLHFSKKQAATDAFNDVMDGHATDVSAGYKVLKREFVKQGDSKVIAGRTFDGPVNVVTKWRLREVSLTPIGADDQAKLRGLDPAAVLFKSPGEKKEEFKMNEQLRKLCIEKGMDSTLTDDQAQRWLIDNAAKLGESKPVEKKEPEAKRDEITAESIATMIAEATRKELEKHQAARAAFMAEVDQLCDLADVPESAAHCRTLEDITAVRAFIKKTKADNAEKIPYGGSVRVLSVGADRLREDIGTALTMRALENATSNQVAIDKAFPPDKRAKGASTFRSASMLDMAKECVRAEGIETRGLTNDEIAICALFGSQAAGIRSSAYHTTGSFSNLTLDAVNKSMQVGYTETPSTWRGPMRQGSSVQDFKNIHRMRLGAVPNLPVWNDNSNPEKAAIGDAKETYAVEARSLELDFSYRLLINDDMDALSRVPQQLGAAAARTVNAVAWSQVTANGLTSDGVALFSAATGNRKRKNLETGTAPPTTITLGTMSKNMRLMRGENTPEQGEGADILNLIPRYLIGPPSLETVIRQLVMSAYDPTASQFMMYNTAGTLIPVIEPLLEAASVTAYYLWADPSQIDTVEVTFLAGQETPQVRQFVNDRSLSQSFVVVQSFGAKALNHRGMQKHNGA